MTPKPEVEYMLYLRRRGGCWEPGLARPMPLSCIFRLLADYWRWFGSHEGRLILEKWRKPK